MATCPCECGVRVPFNRGGAAKQYRAVTETLVLLYEVEADLKADGATEEKAMAALVRQGEGIQRNLLDHLHKQAHPRTHPDLMTMFHEIQRWNADWQCLMTSIMASSS